LALIADDLVRHFEARLEIMDGKAMIVCMSRRILRGALSGAGGAPPCLAS
jgi:hypothetical protein